MLKLEKEIIAGANITLATTTPISLEKIKRAMIAFKLQGKVLSPTALKKLVKRVADEPTPEELIAIHTEAELAFVNLKSQKKTEKDHLITRPEKLPAYVFERIDADGMPTGDYDIDYIKYSDFLHGYYHVHNLCKNLFCYDIETNTYRRHTNHIETHIRDTFKVFSIHGKLHEAERELLTHMKSMGCIDQYPFIGKYGTIHVQNGCLSLATGVLSDPTADCMYDYRIETKYRKFPEGTPELDKFLEQYGTREPIDILAKCLWQRAYHDVVKEITVFFGPRDCGKTTLAELIQFTMDGNLTSKNNVSRVLLHDLLQRFGYSGLEGTLLNIGDDLPDMFVKNSNRINTLVGSVVQHIEKKGEDGFDALVTAYYLFTTNNLPPLDDDDDVIWGKIHLEEFEKVMPNDKVPRLSLFTPLICEQLLFRGVEKALEYAKTPYQNSQTKEWVRAKWHESSTDVDKFMVEETEYDASAQLSLDAIKAAYEVWCKDNGRKRYMKYLTKKLQPYFRRTNAANIYTLKLIHPVMEVPDVSNIVNRGFQGTLKTH